jgi:diguanylate cyclase (GGDEF)-like protein
VNGLRHKIIAGLVTLMLLLGLGSMAWMSWRANANYDRLDRQEAVADFERLLRAFDARLRQSHRIMSEWAHWTEMARFVESGDPAFAAKNLTPSGIGESGLLWVAVLDRQGRPLKKVSASGGPPPDALLDGPYGPLLRTLPADGIGCAPGLIEQNWVVLCRRSIRNTDGGGPVRGILATAEAFTPEAQQEVSSQTGLLFTLSTRPLAQAGGKTTESELVSGMGRSALRLQTMDDVIRMQWPVQDLKGEAVGHLRMDWRRATTLHARSVMEAMGWQLILSFLMITLGMLWLVDRLVVARLKRFNHELRHIYQNKHWHQAVTVHGQDEITELAEGTNALLNIIDSQVRHLESLAETDPLTGLSNRRSFNEVLHRALLTSRRYRRPLCLLVLDVDHFKRYNDRYGHAEGDFALQTVAQCLQGQARRPGDFCARVGGEEFAVILEDTDLEGAMHWMRTTQERLRSLALPHPDNSAAPYLTVSAGVALADDQDDATTLYKRADTALYGAKTAGRNLVVAADPAGA